MKYYVVDAFADRVFAGNPAGVCPLEAWPDDALMQSIAAENNLAETAFFVKGADGYDLRWFTPEAEIDLCGHATLASAYVVANFVEPGADSIRFHTKSGLLGVEKKGELYEMNFPARMPQPVEITPEMSEVIGAPVQEAHMSRDLLLLVESEELVRGLQPDMAGIRRLPGFGTIVTARGESADFVSRFFVPEVGVPEDPVTGSAHSTLIPFWAPRLGKEEMVARQLSKRGGTLYCRNCGERVTMAGNAALYLVGEIVNQGKEGHS